MTQIKTGIYRHFKGNEYRVTGTVKHSETAEVLVLYHPLYGSVENQAQLWVRPLDLFIGMKDVDGKQVKRFEFLHAE